MTRKRTAGALCAPLLIFGGFLHAQENAAAQPPAAVGTTASVPTPAVSTPATASATDAKPDSSSETPAGPDAAAASATPTYRPQKPFFKRLFTVEAVTSTLPGAVLQQVHDWPSEWGKDRLGFEKRVASLYGQFVIGVMIEDAVRTIHHEDIRFHRLGSGGFFKRFGHVVADTVTARNPDTGGRTMSFSLPANAYGSWAIATLWSPRPYRNVDSVVEWGSAGMGTIAIGHLFKEFGPDMLSVFHKKKQ